MLKIDNPLVSDLLERGFKVSAHAYVRGKRVQVQCIAVDKKRELKFDACSWDGVDSALAALARKAAEAPSN